MLPWIERALTTWLYLLGIVELAVNNGAPVAVRLTDLGRTILHPASVEDEPAPVVSTPAAAGDWVVQPNFEIVAYLERISPQRLAFLERHAERMQAQEHVAQYRLTRESIYAALESGSRLDAILTTLETGSGRPLPQNVAAEIREWAALREQIAVHRRARLLEYRDPASRDAAAAALHGVPVGDRFLLATSATPAQITARERVDYTRPLARCLLVTEEGALTRTLLPADLLLDAQVGRWAERLGDGRWQLTQAGVAAATAAGLPISELLRLLADRLAGTLPPWLEIALRAWAGETMRAALVDVVMLQCNQPAVFAAIVGSPRLRSSLHGELAPNLLLIDRAKVEAFQTQLRWAGLTLTTELTVTRTTPGMPRGR
jgi:hypothetical protein